jgi:ribose transport system substrate-binding protein
MTDMLKSRFCACVGGLALLAVAVTGCGSSASSGGSFSAPKTVSVDVGLDKPITIEEGEKPNVAVFTASGNQWDAAWDTSLRETAKSLGVSVTVFDSKHNAQMQADQVNSAITSGNYNAFIITAWDANLMCKPVREAAAKEILVVLSPNTICGRETNPWGPSYVEPGTLAVVDAEQSVTYKRGWVEAVNERLQAGDRVVLAAGPETDPLYKALKSVIDTTIGQRSDITLLPTVFTDYTSPTTLTKMQDFLAAHQDTTAVMSVYSEVTRGTLQAIKQLGLTDKIRLYDVGAGQYSIDQIKAGNLEMTVPLDPIGGPKASLQAIVDTFSGKTVDKFIDTFPGSTGGSVDKPHVIDSSNVGTYNVQY